MSFTLIPRPWQCSEHAAADCLQIPPLPWITIEIAGTHSVKVYRPPRPEPEALTW
jgi:hypothetical protein